MVSNRFAGPIFSSRKSCSGRFFYLSGGFWALGAIGDHCGSFRTISGDLVFVDVRTTSSTITEHTVLWGMCWGCVGDVSNGTGEDVGDVLMMF